MSVTLLNAQIELSKQLGDSWASASTSAGAAGGTTIVDTALMAKNNDWIDANAAEMYDMLVSSSSTDFGEERRISSLANSTGTLTVLAHSKQNASGISYQVHRMFSASDKRIALVNACRYSYPSLHKIIRDETRVSGNWLKDGSFEVWTSSSALTYWTVSASTLAQTSTAYYFKHGAYSCKVDTAAGYVGQSVTNWDDLKKLAGKRVRFTLQGWCDTASCLRIAIVSGTTITYSGYHSGDSAWTEDNDPMSVEATIGDNPTVVAFRVYHDVAAGTSYADDARVISATIDNPRIYIGDLGFDRHEPHGVFLEQAYYSNKEPWLRLHEWSVDHQGYLYLPHVSSDYRLRIEGTGFLDFLASNVSSTAWTATIDITTEQLEILVAQAALYLFRQKVIPNWSTTESQRWQEAGAYWMQELNTRKAKYGMVLPPATSKWG